MNEPPPRYSFLFPPDRFPSWEPAPVEPVLPEEFGPPLSFNPLSLEYRKWVGQDIRHPAYQFEPTKAEIQAKKMEVHYNAVDDVYHRPEPDPTHPVQKSRWEKTPPVRMSGWQNCLWRCYNMERIVETDHDMAYLARLDTTEENGWKAFGEYRFNLRRAGLKIKSLHVRLPFKTYRDGKVRVWVCSTDDYTILLDPQELKLVVRAKGWDDFIVRVELSGTKSCGQYKNTFQDAQLFREPLRRHPDWEDPFRVVIEME